MNPHEPLWLPPGSVRAIMALLLVLVTCYLALVGQITAETFITLVAAVVAYYFGSKTAQTK